MTRTLLHLTFQIGGRGAFHNSIIGNLIINQDRIDRNLLQLLAHPENSEWCSTISVSIFVVNIVSVQKQTLVTIFLFFVNFRCPQLFYCNSCSTAVPTLLRMTSSHKTLQHCLSKYILSQQRIRH